jgi:hypothetical protein
MAAAPDDRWTDYMLNVFQMPNKLPYNRGDSVTRLVMQEGRFYCIFGRAVVNLLQARCLGD